MNKKPVPREGRWELSSALIGLCVLPLFIGYYPWGVERVTDSPLFLLGLAGTVGVVGTAGRLGSRWRELWPLILPATAFLGILAAAALFSGRMWGALFGVSYSMLGLVEMVAVAGLVGSAALLRGEARGVLEWVAMALLLVEAVLVVSQLATGAVITGTLSNDTYMGQAVTLLLPVVAVPLLRGRRSFGSAWLPYSAVAAGLAAVALAEDRTSQVLVGVWLFCVVFQYVLEGRRRARLGVVALAVAFVCALGAVVARYGPRLSADPSGPLAERRAFWSAGWKAFVDRPLLGYGPDGFRTAVARLPESTHASLAPFRPPTGSQQIGVDPHNLIVWLAVCGGIACLAALVWLITAIVRRWRVLAVKGEPVAEYASGVLLYVGSLAMAPAPLQTLPLFALVLGLSIRATPDGGTVESRDRRDRWKARAVVAVAGFACVLTLLYGATRLWVGATPSEVTTADARRSQIAATVWHADPFLWYTASLRWGSLVAAGASQGAADLSAIARATTLEPRNHVYALEHALTLAFYRYPPDQVESAFHRALNAFPDSPQTNREYARYLIATGSPLQAEAFMLRAVASAPEWPDALDTAASYYEATGDVPRAREFRQKAAAARATSGGM